jgi:hypothetical protein
MMLERSCIARSSSDDLDGPSRYIHDGRRGRKVPSRHGCFRRTREWELIAGVFVHVSHLTRSHRRKLWSTCIVHERTARAKRMILGQIDVVTPHSSGHGGEESMLVGPGPRNEKRT